MGTTSQGSKAKVQKFGSFLSGMVMPNIAAFIAWGLLTALFIETGWLPNEQLAEIVGPMITYLLPILIAISGGKQVYGERGGVIAAIATIGVIVGSDVTMFIGAMAMGPFAAWVLKKFDSVFQDKVKSGFEMLYNNFSSGIIGFLLGILGFFIVGPFVSMFTDLMGNGVQWILDNGLLPLSNILIEPAKILFLNNAINHGILTPLGTEQAIEGGKSILFLLEANPGPGLGILLAYVMFGKGSAKSSAIGASVIHFLGGIHEIYFPYVLMNPLLFLAVIGGGVAGTFVNSILGSGLVAAASPGSIFAILAMAPKGGMLSVILGVLAGAIVSFLIAAVILKASKNEEDTFEEKVSEVQQSKAESKGQSVEAVTTVQNDTVNRVIFACDAGMGSSAMGASLLRKKFKEAGIEIDVTNSAINNLQEEPNLLVITQMELAERARVKVPNAEIIPVENFLNSPKYEELIQRLK